MTEAQFEALWIRLVKKKHGESTDALTTQERLFYGVNRLRGSVPRSGFIGYFEHSTGDDVRDAHAGLQVMQLDDVLTLLQRAQAIVLRDQPLPAGTDPIEVLPGEWSEEAFETAMDELDLAVTDVQKSFYECDENIFAALCQYADQHGLT